MNEKRQSSRYLGCLVGLMGLLLLVVAFNFLNFQAMSSQTETNHSLSTSRMGSVLPANMRIGFELPLLVTGPSQTAEAVEVALQKALESKTNAGTVTLIQKNPRGGDEPLLMLQLTPDRFWSPVYAKGTLTAQLYYASDGLAPWPLDEPLILEATDEVQAMIKAEGEFTVTDTSWGLISKPSYVDHLAEALAEAVVAGLQQDVFTLP